MRVWQIIAVILAGIIAVALDFIVAVLRILFDPVFLSGFAVMMMQVALVSIGGGVVGTGVGKLVLKSNFVTESTIRFLRLGRWLPVFVAWTAPTWWSPWAKLLHLPAWAGQILQVVIATFPAIVFAACYYHLSAHHTLQLNQRAALSIVLRHILRDALLFSFLAQVLLYPMGWQWYSIPYELEWVARPFAASLLLAGILFFLNLIGNYNFKGAAELISVATVRQLRESSGFSLLGAGVLWLLCFALWDRFLLSLEMPSRLPHFDQCLELATGSFL